MKNDRLQFVLIVSSPANESFLFLTLLAFHRMRLGNAIRYQADNTHIKIIKLIFIINNINNEKYNNTNSNSIIIIIIIY